MSAAMSHNMSKSLVQYHRNQTHDVPFMVSFKHRPLCECLPRALVLAAVRVGQHDARMDRSRWKTTLPVPEILATV